MIRTNERRGRGGEAVLFTIFCSVFKSPWGWNGWSTELPPQVVWSLLRLQQKIQMQSKHCNLFWLKFPFPWLTKHLGLLTVFSCSENLYLVSSCYTHALNCRKKNLVKKPQFARCLMSGWRGIFWGSQIQVKFPHQMSQVQRRLFAGTQSKFLKFKFSMRITSTFKLMQMLNDRQ